MKQDEVESILSSTPEPNIDGIIVIDKNTGNELEDHQAIRLYFLFPFST